MNVRTLAWMSVAAAGLAMSACGGGNDAPSPLAEVPPSASQSTEGLVGYVESLRPLAADAETADPVPLDNFQPPTSESDDPKPLAQ